MALPRNRRPAGGFEAGWGGLDSTLVVRLLEERGLVIMSFFHRGPGEWKVTGLTELGRQVLARWNESEET